MLDKNLSWYFDKENIPAQGKLVVPTYNYFQEGLGKEFFKPLDFLNLLRKQYQELVNYLDSPLDFIIHIKNIPLTPRELHILYGFILKWFGGYPVHNLNEEFDKILKIIQKEFLNFEGPTPEKEFCKVDFEQRKEFMKLSIAATTAINTGVDLKIIYDGLTGKAPVEKISFSTFPDMFETAYNNNAFGPYNNEIEKLINRDKYNLEFNIWLQEKEYWSYGDEEGYKSYLTKERFLEFLQYEQAEKAKQVEAHRKETATWVVNKNEIKPTTKSKSDFTKDKLETLVIGFASEYGYFRPSTILDEYLRDAESFDDFDFMCNFFLNIHYICQANAELFWNDSHKKDITSWLQKAPIITDVFSTTWSYKTKQKQSSTPAGKKNNKVQNHAPLTSKPKPIFKPTLIATIFNLLKDFFNANQQSQFRDMLETGDNSPEQLIFLDSGNRLADAFKQLKKSDIITGCDQKELEEWIYNNFLFRHRQTIKSFTLRYLNDIISTNSDPCKKPILNVKIDKSTGEVSINKT